MNHIEIIARGMVRATMNPIAFQCFNDEERERYITKNWEDYTGEAKKVLDELDIPTLKGEPVSGPQLATAIELTFKMGYVEGACASSILVERHGPQLAEQAEGAWVLAKHEILK